MRVRMAKQRTAACDEPFGRELRAERLSRIEFRKVASLVQRFQPVGAGACTARCSIFFYEIDRIRSFDPPHADCWLYSPGRACITIVATRIIEMQAKSAPIFSPSQPPTFCLLSSHLLTFSTSHLRSAVLPPSVCSLPTSVISGLTQVKKDLYSIENIQSFEIAHGSHDT